MPDFIRHNTWPALCREWLLRASDEGRLPVPVEDVGGEWRRSFMIDVAGISRAEKTLILGISHWDETPAGLDEIEAVAERTRSIVPKDEHDWTVYYVGFSAGGWTAEAQRRAESVVREARPSSRARNQWRTAGICLLDLADVDRDLADWSG